MSELVKKGPPGERQETSPSFMRSDDPVVARFIGMISASLVIFGGLVLFFISRGWTANVSPAWATIWLTLGVAGLLFHAAYQFARILFVRPSR